jgi:hypothetical protein
MKTRNVTVSLDEGLLDSLQAAAKEDGVSFSALLNRAAKDAWLRRQGLKYRALLERATPEEKAEREAWLDASEQRLAEVLGR